MWQRFTEHARRVVYFSQEEAGRLGQNYVSTEHLLLGLIRENDSKSARILDALGVSSEQIRSEIEGQAEHGQRRPGQDMQLSPGAKRVVDLAYKEARRLNHNYIGSEHLLLGLIREGGGLAGQVLAKLGVDLERTRQEVAQFQIMPGEKPEVPLPDMSGMLNKALPEFKVEYGRQVREKREQMGMAPGFLLPMLDATGISLSADEFALLEKGDGPDPDLCLMLALAFLLEMSVDKALFAALIGAHNTRASEASEGYRGFRRLNQGLSHRRKREDLYLFIIVVLAIALLWVASSRAMVRQELRQARSVIADQRRELHALRGQMHGGRSLAATCNDDLEQIEPQEK